MGQSCRVDPQLDHDRAWDLDIAAWPLGEWTVVYPAGFLFEECCASTGQEGGWMRPRSARPLLVIVGTAMVITGFVLPWVHVDTDEPKRFQKILQDIIKKHKKVSDKDNPFLFAIQGILAVLLLLRAGCV